MKIKRDGMKRHLLLIFCSVVILFGENVHKVVYELTTGRTKGMPTSQ